jgi:hypothetical protein
MTKITEIEIEGIDGQIQKHIILDHGNNEFTSMPKSIYDESIINNG